MITIDMSGYNPATAIGEDPKITAFKKQINERYPLGDCISMDISLKKITQEIQDVFSEKAGDRYKVDMVSPSKVKNVSYGYVEKYNKAWEDRRFYINKMSDLLPYKKMELENEFSKSECRNLFEKKRLEDIGLGLTKQAGVQEKSVLSKSYNEQYLYIGIGAIILLLGLYVVSKKNK